ncbi:MAG: DEAD/DEAH box helicase [Wenzhouxiangellaceae bacterium]|nr:DEAD/DEAH box helicase [Wenzhouxiangellaceae bacterium]
MKFDELGLATELLRALDDLGFSTPTPVQARAIPEILSGRDVTASAQTGTGKTAAFLLPTLDALVGRPPCREPRLLVVTPTRELAAQVESQARALCRHLPLRSMAVFGGVNIRPQENALRRGTDVLVATPGRLLDLASRGSVSLSSVETLVLDEADRMLDLGFRPDIERIVGRLPVDRRTLLFSATFSREILALAARFQRDAVRIETAAPNSTVDRIHQRVIRVDQRRKRELLSWMIGSNDWRQVLVFMRTKHGANRLARQLESDGIPAAAIHGNKSQGARTRALKDFKTGRVRTLVATDIAARGLDIELLPRVVNFEIPNVAEDYVHRIGRTGRAGSDGQAISLVSATERSDFAGIRKLVGLDLPYETIDGYEPEENPAETAGNARRGGGRSAGESARRSAGRRSSGRGNRRGSRKAA